MPQEELVRLLDSESKNLLTKTNLILARNVVVNPGKESGRVTLITRYGAGKVCSNFILFIFSSEFSSRYRSRTICQDT